MELFIRGLGDGLRGSATNDKLILAMPLWAVSAEVIRKCGFPLSREYQCNARAWRGNGNVIRGSVYGGPPFPPCIRILPCACLFAMRGAFTVIPNAVRNPSWGCRRAFVFCHALALCHAWSVHRHSERSEESLLGLYVTGAYFPHGGERGRICVKFLRANRGCTDFQPA